MLAAAGSALFVASRDPPASRVARATGAGNDGGEDRESGHTFHTIRELGCGVAKSSLYPATVGSSPRVVMASMVDYETPFQNGSRDCLGAGPGHCTATTVCPL